MDARKIIVEQIGNLVVINAEQAAQIAALERVIVDLREEVAAVKPDKPA